MSQALVDDDLWTRIEPLLPKRRPRNRQHAGRTPLPDRAVLTGILFVLRSGIPWKMLPKEMGCGSAARVGVVSYGGSARASGNGSIGFAHGVAPTGPTRSGARGRRQRLAPRAAREKTGPNPTDRRKAGSKHHVLTDANGIPVVARLTSANRHDVTQVLPLVDSIPPLRGCPGRPLRKPAWSRRPRV